MTDCRYFTYTMKGNLCRCGAKWRDHSDDVKARSEWMWGWRARTLTQPDSAEIYE